MSMKVCIHATPSNINTFEVDPKLKVEEFKKTIRDKFPYIKKTSFFNKKTNKYIDDEKSFSENNINNLDELLIILRLSGSYQLQVNVFNNRTNKDKFIIITVDGSDTIDEVKQKIIDNLGDEYKNRNISLHYNDIHLYDDELLRNYKINETSIIRCSV